MNHPLNYYKNGQEMLILASDRYFQLQRTITIYLVLAMKLCPTHVYNGSPLSIITTNGAQSPIKYYKYC